MACCVIHLKAAMGRWVHGRHYGFDMVINNTQVSVAFKHCSVDARRPRVSETSSPTLVHQREQHEPLIQDYFSTLLNREHRLFISMQLLTFTVLADSSAIACPSVSLGQVVQHHAFTLTSPPITQRSAHLNSTIPLHPSHSGASHLSLFIQVSDL